MIHLRDIQSEDKEKILKWRNLPEVAKYMYTDHYVTPKNTIGGSNALSTILVVVTGSSCATE